MPVINEITPPKGNINMILGGTRNDDSTIVLPNIKFDFYYNNEVIKQLNVNGNTWIGFGISTEHLSINRKDTSFNNLYYAEEVEYNTKLFRVRFEGNSYYSAWESNDLIWEFSIFEAGIMRLVIEKSPNNGRNSFLNPGVGTQTLDLVEGKSYIFIPADIMGNNYLIQEGSYIPCLTKFLIVDTEGVKSYQNSIWSKIGELPLTEEMFKNFGVDTLPNSTEGLIGNSPALYIYTDNPEVKANKNKNRFYIENKVTSKPKIVIQDYDFMIHNGKTINKLEAIIQYTKKDANLNDIETNGKIRMALSIDSGVSWLTYNINTSKYENIDITDVQNFLSQGIDPKMLTNIDYLSLNSLINQNRKLRCAYIFEKPTLDDICKLKKMKIYYS